MSPSRAPFDVQVLCMVEQLLGLIETVDDLSKNGDEARAGEALKTVVGVSADLRPVVKGVIAAKRQAAEMRDASERTATTIGRVVRFQTQEHLHAANDKTQPPSPQEPSPSVA